MINNRSFLEAEARKLVTQQTILHCPEKVGRWSYSHHPYLAVFQGKLYAMWSSGRAHEDMFGQRVMISRSENGVDWEAPRVLLDSVMGEHSEGVLTAMGFYQHDGTLYGYAGYFEYDIACTLVPSYHKALRKFSENDQEKMVPENYHKNTRSYIVSTTDGENWTPMREWGLPIVSNYPPQKTDSGRLILSGNFMFPYTDDPTGLSGWIKAGLFPKEEYDTIADDCETHQDIPGRTGNPWVCEGSFYQTDDKVIHMLLRGDWIDEDTNFLRVSASKDDGQTWSRPELTSFSDDCSKFFCGRLPDKRFFIISNPVTHNRQMTTGRRCPLVISLSQNGEDFDQFYVLEKEPIPMKFPGIYKRGIYGYPHAVIWGDRMYVIYSINKEQIAVSSFELVQLK